MIADTIQTTNVKKYFDLSGLWWDAKTKEEQTQISQEQDKIYNEFTLEDYDCMIQCWDYPPAIKAWERARAKYLAAHPTPE